MRYIALIIALCILPLHATDINQLIKQSHQTRTVLSLNQACNTCKQAHIPLLREILENQDYVFIVKFSDDTQCGQCKLFAQLFTQTAKARTSICQVPAVFIHADIGACVNLLHDFTVTAIPSVFVYYQGKRIRANASPMRGFENFLNSIQLKS